MTFQVTDVHTPLASVSKIIAKGNRVVFERGNCYIEHLKTNNKTQLMEENGLFNMEAWFFARQD